MGKTTPVSQVYPSSLGTLWNSAEQLPPSVWNRLPGHLIPRRWLQDRITVHTSLNGHRMAMPQMQWMQPDISKAIPIQEQIKTLKFHNIAIGYPSKFITFNSWMDWNTSHKLLPFLVALSFPPRLTCVVFEICLAKSSWPAVSAIQKKIILLKSWVNWWWLWIKASTSLKNSMWFQETFLKSWAFHGCSKHFSPFLSISPWTLPRPLVSLTGKKHTLQRQRLGANRRLARAHRKKNQTDPFKDTPRKCVSSALVRPKT